LAVYSAKKGGQEAFHLLAPLPSQAQNLLRGNVRNVMERLGATKDKNPVRYLKGVDAERDESPCAFTREEEPGTP